MKEKIFKKGIMKRLFSMVLALTMISGMMSGMTLTVQALEGYDDVQIDGETYLYEESWFGTDFDGLSLICQRHSAIAKKDHAGEEYFRIRPETMDAFIECRSARHIGKKCTVTFDMQGYGTAPEPQIMLQGGQARIPEDPYAEGLVFGGWFVDSDCNSRYNFDLHVDHDITLYAKWLTPYTVTFDVQEHGTAPAFQTVYGGEKATKPTDPTAAGFQFEGWYKEAACTNEWNFSSDTVTEATTLYAKWTAAAHTWTYSVGSGAESNKLKATCNGSCGSASHDVTLTLTASSANYTGNAVEASYDNTSKTAWTAAGLALPTITYEAKTGSSLTSGEAVNVGSYTASITVGTGADAKTATKDFEINKAAQSGVTVTMAGYTYNGTPSTPGTSGTIKESAAATYHYNTTDSNQGGNEWAGVTGTTLEPGTYYMYATLAETTNYNAFTTPTASFTVNGANFGTSDVTATAYTGTYDGQSHGIAVNVKDGITGTTTTYCATSDGEYSTTPITKTDAGTYTVYYKVTKTGYNAKTDSSTITITAKALTADDITVTAPTSNGSALNDSITVKFGNTTLVKGTDYEVTYDPAEVKDAGEYKATLTFKGNYSGTSVEKTFTVSKPSSGGSSAPTVTVPVTGNENSVKVSASVSGSTATVKTMTDAELNKVTGGEAVEIDLTGLKKDIDTAKLPTEMVEKIADKDGMSVKLSTATVTFDKAATQEIASQADGSTIQLVVDDIKTVSLNAVQKEAVQKLDAALIIDAYLVSNGTRLCSESKGGFGGGKASVALPYEIKGNRTAANYSVYYVDDAGKLEKLAAKYDAELGAFVFDITHFSNYVVAYDANAMPFADVPAGKYYYDAVKWALENGITEGKKTTLFDPSGSVTRAQVVTFLWRAAGKPVVNYAMSMSDVASGKYYTEAVRWALAEGITKGTDAAHFSPNATCTRGQIVSFLYRYAKAAASETTNPFTDVKAGAYYYDAVLWAVENGITGGKTAMTFVPKEPCTRAQVVTFLYRYMDK